MSSQLGVYITDQERTVVHSFVLERTDIIILVLVTVN